MFHFLFFFQAEDGIRDDLVTGVQTCALPICDVTYGEDASQIRAGNAPQVMAILRNLGIAILKPGGYSKHRRSQIGRASCRERVENSVGAVLTIKKQDRVCSSNMNRAFTDTV